MSKQEKQEVNKNFEKLASGDPVYAGFTSICKLAKIFKTLPPHTADCERDFSKMTIIKTDLHNGLSEDSLDCLMHISIEGPPIEQFDAMKAV